MIIQIPIFIALYRTLTLFLINKSAAAVIKEVNGFVYTVSLKIVSIDPSFLGFNLALSPSKAHIWFYYLIPVVTGLLQYFQAAAMTPPTPAPAEKGEKDKSSTQDDFQKAMNTQMKYLFPVLIAWFAYTLPVGLSLYWNIFSIFSIYQQAKVKKNVELSIGAVK